MSARPPGRARIVGLGRAGGSVAAALAAIGWEIAAPFGRGTPPEELAGAADGVNLVVIGTPDATIAEVAAAIAPDRTGGAVITHLSGSLGLEVLTLAGHERVAGLHPLVAMPSAEIGAQRLRDGAWFAVAGDPLVRELVDAWGGQWFEVADDDRAMYHAAACVASNHLVGLLGQVERLAADAGVPFDAYLPLVEATLANVRVLGPARALTGPAARGDWPTIERHRAALDRFDPRERAAYDAGVEQARRLVDL